MIRIAQILRIKHCLQTQLKRYYLINIMQLHNSESVSWGVGGRRFKSCHADQYFYKKTNLLWLVFFVPVIRKSSHLKHFHRFIDIYLIF